MEIFEALREDHDTQRDLLARLVETEGNTQTRRDLLRLTRDALVHHEVAEERYFYTPLMEADLTQEQARHSIAEHHEIDEVIKKLEATDPSSTAWLGHARKLRELVTHHLDEEEHQVFQQAGKVLSDEEKRDLAQRYRIKMKDQAAGN